MDLFEVPIPRARRSKFPTIAALEQLANEFKKSSERFEVKYLARGVIHVDLSDGPTAKTVDEILALNGDILVGEQRSFSDELQKLGFSHDFINKYSRYKTDIMFDSSASSTDSTMLHDPSSIPTWVAFLSNLGDNNLEDNKLHIRSNLEYLPKDLTRPLMELVARMCNAFCYIATVATAEEFLAYVSLDIDEGRTSKTLMTYHFNEALKKASDSMREETKEVKTFYYDSGHIS